MGVGGTSPKPPGRGLRPLHPLSPPPFAGGLPGFRVPLVGGSAGVSCSPPFYPPIAGGYEGLGAYPPGPPGGGSASSTPDFAHTPLLRVHQGFWSHSCVGLPPRRGVSPLQGSHPRWLRVCQHVGAHLWAGSYEELFRGRGQGFYSSRHSVLGFGYLVPKSFF